MAVEHQSNAPLGQGPTAEVQQKPKKNVGLVDVTTVFYHTDLCFFGSFERSFGTMIRI